MTKKGGLQIIEKGHDVIPYIDFDTHGKAMIPEKRSS